MSTAATNYVDRCYAAATASAEDVKTHAAVVGEVYDRLKVVEGELSAIKTLAISEPKLSLFQISTRITALLDALDSLQKEIDGS